MAQITACGGLLFDADGFEIGTSKEIKIKASGIAHPAATAEVAGTVKQIPNIADSTAITAELLAADFNALLAALVTAGIMAAPAEPEG